MRDCIALPRGKPGAGHILELYQGHFTLPELGPIGSSGLANACGLQARVADFEEDHENTEWTLYGKLTGTLSVPNSPIPHATRSPGHHLLRLPRSEHFQAPPRALAPTWAWYCGWRLRRLPADESSSGGYVSTSVVSSENHV